MPGEKLSNDRTLLFSFKKAFSFARCTYSLGLLNVLPVQADDDEDHRAEVEAERPEEGERFAGQTSGQPETSQAPGDLRNVRHN